MTWSRLDVAARRRLVYWVLEGCLVKAREQYDRQPCTAATVDMLCAAALREALHCADIGAFADAGVHDRHDLRGLACRGEIMPGAVPSVRVLWDVAWCETLCDVLEVRPVVVDEDVLPPASKHTSRGYVEEREPRPAFATEEEAFTWLDAEADDPCIDNRRVAYLADHDSLCDYDEARAGGCCGYLDVAVTIAGQAAIIGLNYGH